MKPPIVHRVRAGLVAVTTAAILSSTFLAAPAGATARAPDVSSFSPSDVESSTFDATTTLDPAVFLEGLVQLEASTVPRETLTDGGNTYHRYIVNQGALTLPSADDVRAAMESGESDDLDAMRPFLEARFSGMRMAIGFNTVDQQALAAGGGAAIAAALCVIPGVGWAACAVIGVVVSVGTTYVLRNGICSGGRKLWWYDVSGGSTVGCRSSAPF
jgi:hypothetical protein